MIQEGIRLAAEGTALSVDLAEGIMDEMMSGKATPSQMASFLTAMRVKGETKDELLGFVKCMRSKAKRVSAPEGAVDLCGTGGDGARTFNISTVASFVVAACGVPVAKHGNRAISSRSGSADVLTALGIPITLAQADVERCVKETGIGFMFAPRFHESMRNVMATRREIGIRTFFNILGPMSNPADVKRQLIGVYDPRIARTIAEVMHDLGSERVMVVHGAGMDEITNTGPTKVVELRDGDLHEYEITPETFGLDLVAPADLAGGSAQDNARMMLSILGGDVSPRADVVAMNSAAALVVAERASNLEEGFAIATEAMAAKKGLDKLKSFCEKCNALEGDAQKNMDTSDLFGRRILPDTLRSRCGDITADLVSRISGIERGKTSLEGLDSTLLQEPSVLSVLVLNRMMKVLTGPKTDTPTDVTKSKARFSDSIADSRGLAVIGEYKPRSPSTIGLHVPPDPDMTASVYSGTGVACTSVLVEEDFFGGGADLFSRFRARVSMPMLFKDFIVSERQLLTARTIGADAVLLIAKALNRNTLDRLVGATLEMGLEPVVEVHDKIDLEKVDSCESTDMIEMIGVNGRDQRTLDVDIERTRKLRELLGKERLVIAESGMRAPEDVGALKGFDGVLIGSMFMQAEKLEETVRRTVVMAAEVRA
ncbi:MAG: anthranilate phosphoribosyltransferase [Thermoplasmata archaeon]|nr:anthranilate phosphoribosyltransferase [Thermoplasmata archaeon]